MNHFLLADLTLFGIGCGAYLQYKSFKAIGELAPKSERRRRLDRTETLKVVELVAYAALAVVFETVTLSHAIFY